MNEVETFVESTSFRSADDHPRTVLGRRVVVLHDSFILAGYEKSTTVVRRSLFLRRRHSCRECKMAEQRSAASQCDVAYHWLNCKSKQQ
jgi:hypothetical protein